MEEYFDVVDDNDNVMGKARRSECHSNPKLIHRGILVFVINGESEVLLQKRSMEKDTNPGKWDISVAGHNGLGESYQSAARREIEEDLGVTLNIRKIGKTFTEYANETEFNTAFVAFLDGQKIEFDKNEIEEIKFCTVKEAKKLPKNEVSEKFHETLDFYVKLDAFKKP